MNDLSLILAEAVRIRAALSCAMPRSLTGSRRASYDQVSARAAQHLLEELKRQGFVIVRNSLELLELPLEVDFTMGSAANRPVLFPRLCLVA